MFHYLVPPKELHSLAMLARLSLVGLSFASSTKMLFAASKLESE